MALQVMGNYYKKKSIKLSDAFTVYIKLNDKDQEKEYTTCTGFTLPKLEFTEETQFYGNTSQTFLIPNYESCKELTLEFYEVISDKDSEIMELFIENNMAYKLDQKYLDGLAVNNGTYTNKYIKSITINILDNRLNLNTAKYKFRNLKISNYTLYNLNYTQDSPCKISITFSFESLEII